MYQFIWPIVLLLLPLPWLIRQWGKGSVVHTPISGALRVPFLNRLQKLGAIRQDTSRLVHPLLWCCAWICFVVAAARPVWVGEPQILNKEARNIVLTLDVSASMEEKDFDFNGRSITRLAMVKYLAKDFIQKRAGDNIGLVIFGSEAYTYAPLSPDTTTLDGLMDEVGLGIAGNQTAMGDALAMAVQTAAAVPENSRIVILMSDGITNAGVVQMDEALKIAKQAHVKVYTIGIGSDRRTTRDLLGFVQTNPSVDLDEETLRKVAAETGGQYFRAKSTKDLQQIYNTIDELETTEAEDITIRPRRELAYLFVLIGLACWFLAVILGRLK